MMAALSYDVDGKELRQPVSKFTKLRLLFFPDVREILLLVLAYTIGFRLIGPLFDINDNNALLVFSGLTGMCFFAYRWGYSSVFDLQRSNKSIAKAHAKGKVLVTNFKLFGLLVSLISTIIGYQVAF
jgi:hypothetical protein